MWGRGGMGVGGRLGKGDGDGGLVSRLAGREHMLRGAAVGKW